MILMTFMEVEAWEGWMPRTPESFAKRFVKVVFYEE